MSAAPQRPGVLPPGPTPLNRARLQFLDDARRSAGRMLDAVGLGPHTSSCRIHDPAAGVRLREFSPDTATGPVVLLVPAPIKRWYIWDLQPDRSVVARHVAAGMRVFVAEWTDAGPSDQDRGLDDYADRLLASCITVIGSRTGTDRVTLIGHSLGGTLAAIFAARHPKSVAGVMLLEAPLHFGPGTGAFAPMVQQAPDTAWALRMPRGVPGSFLNSVSATASPRSFQFERYVDLIRSTADPSALTTHLRVQRWTMDELALPGALFNDVVERLYRRDELMAGTLMVTGTAVGPGSVTAPLLSVLDPRSTVFPPSAVLPFHEAVSSKSSRVVHYTGDVGVALQHVGILVGRHAHNDVWPELLDWTGDTWSDAPAGNA